MRRFSSFRLKPSPCRNLEKLLLLAAHGLRPVGDFRGDSGRHRHQAALVPVQQVARGHFKAADLDRGVELEVGRVPVGDDPAAAEDVETGGPPADAGKVAAVGVGDDAGASQLFENGAEHVSEDAAAAAVRPLVLGDEDERGVRLREQLHQLADPRWAGVSRSGGVDLAGDGAPDHRRGDPGGLADQPVVGVPGSGVPDLELLDGVGHGGAVEAPQLLEDRVHWNSI